MTTVGMKERCQTKPEQHLAEQYLTVHGCDESVHREADKDDEIGWHAFLDIELKNGYSSEVDYQP